MDSNDQGFDGNKDTANTPQGLDQTSSHNPLNPSDSPSQQHSQSTSPATGINQHPEQESIVEPPQINIDNEPIAVSHSDDVTEANDNEPNTSVTLNPPSSGHQFTTPLKLLPALKDIETITTPKSFNVARDTSAENVRSSPVEHHKSTQLENLAEAEEDAFDSVANDTFASAVEPEQRGADPLAAKAAELQLVATFIGVKPSELYSLGSDVVTKIAHRSQQYQGTLSELSFFKLNQELISQVQTKKFEVLQKKVEKLSAANDTLAEKNEALTTELRHKDDTVAALRNRVSSLTDQLYKLESTTRESETSLTERIGAKDEELFKANDALNKLTKSNVENGQRLSEVTKELNNVTNEKFTFKLELSKVTNELSYVKSQKDWYEQELKLIQEKYTELIKRHDSHYLKDSNKISSLTSQTETLTTLKESLQAQVKSLQDSLEKERTKASELESQVEIQTIKVSRESSAKDDMIEILNLQLGERAERITQLEEYAEELKFSTADSIGALQKDISDKHEKIILLEERLRRTEEALDSELHKETELPKLAQSAELILQSNPLGISLSSLYTEFNHIKKELALERSQKEKLAVQLQHFVSELESKKPAIANYRNQIQFYEQSMKDMLGKLESVRIDKVESEKESNRLRTRLASYETELQSVKQLSKDLGRQLCYYLIHSKIREGNEDALTSNERRVIDLILAKSGNKDVTLETDTDQLISERLVNFASIVELQSKNEELLLAVRQLGKQLEANENESNGFEVAAVEEAREAILTLQGELDSVTIKLEAVTKERDLIKSLSGSTPEASRADISVLNTSNKDLKTKLVEAETALKDLQKQSAEKIKTANEKLVTSNNAKEELQLKLSSVKHSVELSESRLENSKKMLENVKSDLEYFKKEAIFWKEQASKQESLLVKKSNELRDAENKLLEANTSTKNFSTEKEILASRETSLKDEIAHLKKDKEHLSSFVFNLQSLIKEKELASLDLSNKLAESVLNYQSLQQKIEEKEERILIFASQSEMALKAQNAKLEQVNELSQKLLDAKSKLAEKQVLIESLRKKLTEGTVSHLKSPRVSNATASHFDNEAVILPAEYQDIKNDLKLAEAQVAEFSNIAKAAEDALMKATESFDHYKVTSDEKLRGLQEAHHEVSAELESTKKTVESLEVQLRASENKYLNEVQELKAKVHEYSLKASSYDNLQKDYESKIATINNDLQSQMTINIEIESNYRDKLAEADRLVAEISQEKKVNEDLRSEIANITSKLGSVEADLKSKDETLADFESAKQEEIGALQVKMKDLEYQYNLALNQLELNNNGNLTADADGSEDLRQVVHFLRREKDNAEAKVVSLTDEQSRLKSQIETVSSELNASKSQLSRLQTMKIQLDDATKDHNRLLEQLEQLNILRESNTTLRNENKTTLEQLSKVQAELEELKANPAIPSTTDDTESAVQAQELKLLKEENERLKTQLTNNEEVKNLMQRFENLKNEFKTKLMGHRNKNKELEKQLTETKASLEQAEKHVSQAGLLATDKAQAEKNFADEINKLKAAFETEKTTLVNKLKSDYEQSLKKEVENAKASTSSNGSIDAAKQQVEAEWKAKLEASTKELRASFALELNTKVQQKVNERLAAAPPLDASAVKEEYESKIKQLNEEFEARLARELKSVEKAVDKKYEFKLRVLNRKVERLEKQATPGANNNAKANVQPAGGPQAPSAGGLGSTNGAATDEASRKRPFGNNAPNPANKKAKD